MAYNNKNKPWNKGIFGWRKQKIISIMVECLECHIKVRRYPSTLNKNTFCSQGCRSVYLKKDKDCSSWNRGIHRTKEQKKKMSEIKKKEFQNGRISSFVKLYRENPDFMRGENNPNWIKDRSKVVKSEKKHLDGNYKQWMKSVKNRDNWKCRIADVKCNGRLEAHHILDWKNFPELRYEINNGITLCHAHHPRGRAEEKRLSSYFKELVTVSSN